MLKEFIRQKLNAYELLDRLEQRGFKVKAPINLDKIINMLHIDINKELSFDKKYLSIYGYIKIKNNEPFIWINPLSNPIKSRERFTLAHELGHLFLHTNPSQEGEYIDTKDTLNRHRAIWNAKEKEANLFANQLLMPVKLVEEEGRKLVKNYFKKNPNKNEMPKEIFISVMAEKFMVSRQIMEYRLKDLSVVS